MMDIYWAPQSDQREGGAYRSIEPQARIRNLHNIKENMERNSNTQKSMNS